MTAAATQTNLSGQFIQLIAYQGAESLAAELEDIAGSKAKAAAIADSVLLDFVEKTLAYPAYSTEAYHTFLFLKVLRNHLAMLTL